MTIEEKLKKYILSKFKSLRDFCFQVQIPYSTIDTLLKRGIYKTSIDNIIKICNKLNIDVDALANEKIVEIQPYSDSIVSEEMELIKLHRQLPLRQKHIAVDVIKSQLGLETTGLIKTLKVFTQSACAGDGNFIDSDEYDLVEFDNPPVTASFCVKIQGDSMLPLIKDKQLVFVQTGVQIQDNDIGIFCYQGEVYCKRLKNKNGEIILTSLNGRYNDIYINNRDELSVIGRVL